MEQSVLYTFKMYSLILALFATTAFAATPTDPDCTTGTGATMTINPEGIACADKMESATCGLVFGTPPAAPLTASSAHREAKCQTDSAMKKLALEQCPKFCGYCCKTPEYNCLNKPFAQTGLNCTTLANKCTDPTWRPLIAENCPSTCGMCLQGGCVDKATKCGSQPNICFNTNFQGFARENCARTCNFCPPPTVPTTAGPGAANPTTTASPSANCVDTDVNCANWAKNGKFCNNTFYQDQWNKCRRSCGRC